MQNSNPLFVASMFFLKNNKICFKFSFLENKIYSKDQKAETDNMIYSESLSFEESYCKECKNC